MFFQCNPWYSGKITGLTSTNVVTVKIPVKKLNYLTFQHLAQQEFNKLSIIIYSFF